MEYGYPNVQACRDHFNAALNYFYGMLYHQVEAALACAGLDSQIGLWHRDQFQTPSLAFDCIEPMRPKVDRLLMEIVFRNGIAFSVFERNDKYGYLLTREGRTVLITAFNDFLEEKVKMHGKITHFKNHVLQHAWQLKAHIEKQKL